MTGLPFAPPPVRLTGTTRWVLLRAFGPTAATPPADPVPAEAPARAGRLALTPRIGARAAGHLEAELGSEPAAAFTAARRAAVARDIQLEALVEAVASAAETSSVPVTLLKYAALRAAGVVAPGARLASDLDLLASPGRAHVLRNALLARGFVPTGQPAWEHHLAGLAHPRLGAVEIHVHLPGLVPPGRRRLDHPWLTLDDLERAGLLQEPTRGRSAGAPALRVPAPPVLLAHALVHALVQHRAAPAAYPVWRAVADWIDLGLGADADPLPAALAWTGGGLAPELAAAARALCVDLVQGRPQILEGDTSGALLGRHFLAGTLDPFYSRSITLRMPTASPGAGAATPEERGTLRALARALVPPEAELDTLYGPWRSRWGLLGRRLLRPLDLAGRTLVATASRLVLARGSRRDL